MKNYLDDQPIDVVTGSSADFWILEPLVWALDKLPIKARLVVTGTHVYDLPDRGISVFPNYENVPVVVLEPKRSSIKDRDLAVFTDTFESLANYYGETPPSKVIYLGDRLEILAVAELAHLLNIPSFHLHGGEVTLGSQDDSHRHAITKLSKAHICFSQTAKSRLIQLGEKPENIFVSKSLVLDRISRIIDSPELTPMPFKDERFAILTIHPVTNNELETLAVCKSASEALSKTKDLKILITGPNTDKGSVEVEDFMEALAQKNPEKFQRIHHVGGDSFLRMMQQSKFVIGNSSAGILEAPLLDVPTINIGSRQSGRHQESAVVQCEPNTQEIYFAISKIMENSDRSEQVRFSVTEGSALEVLSFVKNLWPTPVKEFIDV